jgi:hypothetical protein
MCRCVWCCCLLVRCGFCVCVTVLCSHYKWCRIWDFGGRTVPHSFISLVDVHNRCGIFLGCSCIFLFGLLELLPLCYVCFHRNVLCLCAVHMWRCLCYILLRECVLYTLFGMIVLSDLYIVGGNTSILIGICRCCHVCWSFVVLVVGVFVWCWLF